MKTFNIQITAPNDKAAMQMFDILQECNDEGDFNFEFDKVELLDQHAKGKKPIASFDPFMQEYVVNIIAHIDAKNMDDAEAKSYDTLAKATEFRTTEVDYVDIY